MILKNRFTRSPINAHNFVFIIYFGITKTVLLAILLLSVELPNYSGTVASTEYNNLYQLLYNLLNNRFIHTSFYCCKYWISKPTSCITYYINTRLTRHPRNTHNLLLIMYFGITKTVWLLSLVSRDARLSSPTSWPNHHLLGPPAR